MPLRSKLMGLAALAAVLAAAGAANAQVSLNSVRVVAKDAEALGKFYSTAFGMHETNRLQTQNGPEVFLNFGANSATRASSSPSSGTPKATASSCSSPLRSAEQ